MGNGRPQVLSVNELQPEGLYTPPPSGIDSGNVANMAISGATQVATAALTAANPAAMAAKAVGGVVKAVGCLFGGGARRREQRPANSYL